MRLLSVNVGSARAINAGPGKEISGIYKLPVEGSVRITQDGLQTDTICDKKNHGGPDQAVYVYGTADYDWWTAELGQTIEPGTFGENLTVSGLESAPYYIGDRLRIGSVLLEVTAPRIPCVNFATRMGRPDWVKRFRFAERPGVYCRVIEPGEVRANDPVTLEIDYRSDVSVLELYRLYYNNQTSEATLRRILEAPIDIRARHEYQERLEIMNLK
jgi:MOSC domain-containing protein YiiM